VAGFDRPLTQSQDKLRALLCRTYGHAQHLRHARRENYATKEDHVRSLHTREGNNFTEAHEFGYGSKEGKKFTFQWKMEGDKLLKMPPDGKGGSIQVWERFKLPPQSPADKEATSWVSS